MKIFIVIITVALVTLTGCKEEDITVTYTAKGLQEVVTGWAMGAQSVTLTENVYSLEELLFKDFTIQQGKTLVIAEDKEINIEGTILKAGSYTGYYGNAILTRHGNLRIRGGGVLFEADITIGNGKMITIEKDAALRVGKPNGNSLLMLPDEDISSDATFTASGGAVEIIDGMQGSVKLICVDGSIL